MRIVFMGGPLSGRVSVDVPPETSFADILKNVEANGTSLAGFRPHAAEINGKRVRPTARVFGPTETPASVGLAANGAIVVLRPHTADNNNNNDSNSNNNNNNNAEKDKDKDKEEIQTPSARSTVVSTSEATSARDYRSRLIAIYENYEPTKVGTVDATLQKFKGKEEAVIRQLVKKYGPEPENTTTSNISDSATLHTVQQERVTSPHGVNTNASYNERLVAIYQKYDPAKVGTVNATLRKFQGKEEAVIRQLVKKYGPEPVLGEEAPQPPGNVSKSYENNADVTIATGSTVVSTSEATSTRDYRSRLIAIYENYEPTKVGTVDATLQKFKGKEEAVIRQLVKKYGSEPEKMKQEYTQSSDHEIDSVTPRSVLPQSTEKDETVEKVESVTASENISENKKILSEESEMTSKIENKVDSNDVNEVNQVNPAITSLETDSNTIETSGKLQMESYGFQHLISPFTHEPLVEPLSETDEPSPSEKEEEEIHSTKGKVGGIRKHFSLEIANEILKKDGFDPGKRLLRDINGPLSGRQHPVTVLSYDKRNILTSSRLTNVINRAVGSLSDSIANQIRKRYWLKWECKVVQHVANGLIESNIWAKTSDGVKLVDSLPHDFVVQNFDEYILKNRIRARNDFVEFSDDLQKALRLLIYTGKQQVTYLSSEGEALILANAKLSPVRDSKNLTKSLLTIARMLKDIAISRDEIQTQKREYAKLQDENETLRFKLNETEFTVNRLSLSQADFEKSHNREIQLEEKLAETQRELMNSKYQIQHLQRELKNERGKSVTKPDTSAKQKDQAMVSLQQELSNIRSKLYREQKEKESLEAQLKEAKLEAARDMHKVQKSLTPHVTSYSSSTGAGGAASFSCEKSSKKIILAHNLSKGAFSPGVLRPLVEGKISENDFYPDKNDIKDGMKHSLQQKTNMDLLRENLQLEAELKNLQTSDSLAAENEFGSCPHCLLQLASCSGATTGSPKEKAAFCFSCRRFYTFGELETRRKEGSVKLGKNNKSSLVKKGLLT